MKDQTPIELPCKICAKLITTKECERKRIKSRGGIHCKECLSIIASNRLKNLRNTETKEQRSVRGKKARSKADVSKGVFNQWEGFRKNPLKFTHICKRKSDRMKCVWEKYDDATKNRIISSLYNSHGKGSSAIANEMKRQMDKMGISGFVSEQPFHGLVPDELNEKSKIIVEFYGDAYHCNPRKFKDPNLYYKLIHKTVGEQWERDSKRIERLENYGYQVLIIWEYDFRHHPDEQIQRIVDAVSQRKML